MFIAGVFLSCFNSLIAFPLHESARTKKTEQACLQSYIKTPPDCESAYQEGERLQIYLQSVDAAGTGMLTKVGCRP